MTVSWSVKRVTLARPAPTRRAASPESRSNAAGPGTSTSSRRALAMRCRSRRTSVVEGSGSAATRELPSVVGGPRTPCSTRALVTCCHALSYGTGSPRGGTSPRRGESRAADLLDHLPATDPSPMSASRLVALPDCRPLLASPDDLTLAFQPIVDLARATIAGYEALS